MMFIALFAKQLLMAKTSYVIFTNLLIGSYNYFALLLLCLYIKATPSPYLLQMN
jgi:hypothetical protein